MATTPLPLGLWRGTLPPVKVVPPTFIYQNERKGCRNDYLEALDRIRLRFYIPKPNYLMIEFTNRSNQAISTKNMSKWPHMRSLSPFYPWTNIAMNRKLPDHVKPLYLSNYMYCYHTSSHYAFSSSKHYYLFRLIKHEGICQSNFVLWLMRYFRYSVSEMTA